MEIESIKAMSFKLMSSVMSGGTDSKDDIAKKKNEGQKALGSLLSAVQSCQARYGGKTELATEDDVRVADLCERWTTVMSHGMRPPQLSVSTSSIQTIVTAGINFAFNNTYIGTSLWNYTRLHLTRHEEERFKNLKQINTPMGHFKAFLRASLNERSLERYLHSWVGHLLITEYYEEWALMRDSEATSLLPNMAAGLVSILFALSIDKAELNEILPPLIANPTIEPVIAVKAPVMKANAKKKSLRQVISFDTKEDVQNSSKQTKTTEVSSPPALDRIMTDTPASWSSAPPTCVSSPDPNSGYAYSLMASQSEPATSTYDAKKKHFFPEDSTVSSERIFNETPGQILARLSERAKDIFSSKKSLTGESGKDSDLSSTSGNRRLSESESEEGPAEGSISCLELCFPEDEGEADEGHLQASLLRMQEDNSALHLKLTQLDIAHKEKCNKMEKLILDLSRENDRLKEQLRKYVSAVQMLKQDGSQADEVKQYEAKLVQVAEMHAELMEFNDMLQRRLQATCPTPGVPPNLDGHASSLVQIWLPSAFLVTSGSKSFHVYQIFLKLFSEEHSPRYRFL